MLTLYIENAALQIYLKVASEENVSPYETF
jgi:hypothetical protein